MRWTFVVVRWIVVRGAGGRPVWGPLVISPAGDAYPCCSPQSVPAP
ncbi:hypothetical protein [Streptomyces acidicola]